MKNQQSKYSDSLISLSKNRNIFLYETVTKEMASSLCALLIYYDSKNNDPIKMYINSNGGDMSAMFQIYDTMQMIKSPINTICLSKAYSAGSVILAAGTKGMRQCLKHANVMIHGVQLVFPVMPDHDPISSQSYLNFVNNNNENMLAILSKHTGQTIDRVRQDCKRDLFLDCEEAISYGVVDSVLTEL